MTTSRRRGEDLEAAIRQAFQSELLAHGYGGLTFEGVAAAASTSKAVLYRRWPTKAAMSLWAMQSGDTRLIPTPDSGTLRGDLVEILRAGNTLFGQLGRGVMLGILADVDEAAAGTLRELLFAKSTDILAPVVGHARARGELGPAPIPERALAVPLDLLRHESLLRRSLDDTDIDQIVDDCVIPLYVTLSNRNEDLER